MFHVNGIPHLLFKVTTTATTSTTTFKEVNLPEGTLDFVISVSAKNPSFSPLLIGELLRQRGIDVAFPTHAHSSCKVETLTADILSPYGGSLSGRIGTSTKAKVFITFLIKDGMFIYLFTYPYFYFRITNNDLTYKSCMSIDELFGRTFKHEYIFFKDYC